jgi:hypothetical protein
MSDLLLPCKVIDLNPISSLIVYTMLTQKEIDSNVNPNEFWWLDSRNPSGSGPFSSVHSALENWKTVILDRKGYKMIIADIEPSVDQPIDMTNVIKISDFKAKSKR